MSDELMEAIDDLLKQAGLGLGDLDGGKLPSNFYREPGGTLGTLIELAEKLRKKGS